jgi:hypothetical protein
LCIAASAELAARKLARSARLSWPLCA